jgi:hypothetical protein
MQTLRAVFDGKVVEYPLAATFEIGQRKAGQAYSLMAEASNISAAITKFHRVRKPGLTTRVVAVLGDVRKTIWRK